MTDAVFEPIAIVGRGCVLPGAHSPQALWNAVAAGRSLIAPPPVGFGLTEAEDAKTAQLLGGYVSGFDAVFDPERHDKCGLDTTSLDPVIAWLLHAGRAAWDEADLKRVKRSRIGVIAANLSYPSRGLTGFASDIWMDGTSDAPPTHRFNSGLPALALARSIGATGPAFALDAACASSLYALSVACRKLAMRQLDAALVGAVQGADMLLLQRGFAALNALSPTARSRPLTEGGDGLLPAEGAAAVVLKRLSDVSIKERVFGIIRGIGLSNDGRRRGLLAPDAGGQLEAMQAAYRMAGLNAARDIDLLECHATGTPTGDSVELAAAAELMQGRMRALPVGSLKSNMGHLITAAGMGSLLKLMGAMEAETLPPTLIDGQPLGAFKGTCLTPQMAAEPWTRRGDAPRRAALSNFGFGGNNAHLVLEAYQDERAIIPVNVPELVDEIVITGIGLNLGNDRGVTAVTRRLLRGSGRQADAQTVTVSPAFARMPPADLARAQPYQLSIMDTVEEALNGVKLPDMARIGCFVGMGCDPSPARWVLRERIAARLGRAAGAALTDDIASPLTAADTLGAMPNLPANRLTAARDWRGQGYTVSAEALSGLAAVDAAMDALRSGALDMAVVAAGDFAADHVYMAAAADLHLGAGGDGAATLILKRRADAKADGDTVFGTVSGLSFTAKPAKHPHAPDALNALYGRAHAADALIRVGVAAALAQRNHRLSDTGAVAWLSGDTARDETLTFGDTLSGQGEVTLNFDGCARYAPDLMRPEPVLYYAGAGTKDKLLAKLAAGQSGGRGRRRIAILAGDDAGVIAKRAAVLAALRAGDDPSTIDGVFYGTSKPGGELAFVFTGSAASYPRMGRGLLTAFPEIGDEAARRSRHAAWLASLLAQNKYDMYDQLCVVTFISLAHSILARDWLGLSPDAAFGLSLGETNSLIAMGAWGDSSDLLDTIATEEVYSRYLSGRFETAQDAWQTTEAIDWRNWRIMAPLSDVQACVDAEPRAEITIINTENDIIIGGDAAACQRIIAQIGKSRAMDMNQNLIVHCPVAAPFAETWRRMHTRPTRKVPDVRFYTNATGKAYVPTQRSAANNLVKQAINPINFPATVRQAYADGVRTFVELGPRDTMTMAIGEILGDLPHLAVSIDRIDRTDLSQMAEMTAILFAAGHEINIAKLTKRLAEVRSNGWPARAVAANTTQVPAHPPAPILPVGARVQQMPAAPSLPRITPIPAAPRKPYQPPASPPFKALDWRAPTGPKYSRQQLEAASRGKMSDLFGPAFKQQDGYARQVRLPAPPLLLADRVTGLDAEAGKASAGIIWTETDISDDSWMLHLGHIRPGPLIECGQADLTLIGYMGTDFENKSERVYRLLGCDIIYHDGDLPRAGDTLDYQIEITRHAKFGDIRMFFFESDCRVDGRAVFSVREGQAGFFTDEELAASKGVLWSAKTHDPPTEKPASFTPVAVTAKQTFTADDMAALRAGDLFAALGKGFELAAAQTNPAALPAGKLALLDDVEAFDAGGGPWGRGYLKARAHVPADAWFYDGHFHNDPCMPGNLMAEAALQAMEVYAHAVGLTRDRDGFVFEPVKGETFHFECRGQVVPDAGHDITYEVFIDEIIDGDTPVIYAALLACKNGEKVFYCPRFGLRLRRSWPAIEAGDIKPIGPDGQSRGGWPAMKACGDGAPGDAFGAMYAPYNKSGRVPRLPQPPYHMISEVLSVSTPPATPTEGAVAVTRYDVPDDAWYFADNGNDAMPYAVLVEVVLQPCGWLASHGGFAIGGGEYFRNLDGDGEVLREVRAGDGPLTTITTMTGFSRIGTMTIVRFDLTCTNGRGETVMTLKTSFGFFPAEALAKQAGLKIDDTARAQVERDGAPITLPLSGAALPSGRLAMLDHVDVFDAAGGAHGLGHIRGQQAVDPYAWYFKAHFYQDPVQPGSLGLDMLVQLLERAVKLKGLDAGFDAPRFEAVATGHPVSWSYRGQVRPDKKRVTATLDIERIDTQADGSILVVAGGSLWCDGLRIYEVRGLAVRVVEG